MISRRALGLAALLAASTAAQAHVWVDDKGRSLTLEYPGAGPAVLTANGHSIEDGAALFKSACLSGNFGRSQVASVLDGSGWGFAFVDEMMPFKTPVNIGGFRATDAIVNVSEGIFFNRLPQCNLLIRTAQAYEAETARAAVSKLLGAEPTNAADAVKNGKPNKHYQPEWVIPATGGGSLNVYIRPSVTDPAVAHFAVLQKVSK